MQKTIKILLILLAVAVTQSVCASIILPEDTTIETHVSDTLNQINTASQVINGVGTQQHGVVNTSESVGISFNSVFRGVVGIFIILFVAFLVSKNKRGINWGVIAKGLLIQLILAVCVLYVPPVQWFFEVVGRGFVKILDFTKIGSEFLLGGLMDTSSYGVIFAFQILPTIIFFSALTSILFYLGIIQKVVYALAWLMVKAIRLSGAESLAVAGNIFLGQTESPLMVKAYLDKMNKSEIFLVMVAGMATVAGGVMAAYIGFLGGDDLAQRVIFAKHLLTASVMAAPGAVIISKIIIPQTEKIDTKAEITKENIGSNFLDALSKGASEGMKLAVNVAAMLLVFFAFIAMCNYILIKIGDFTHLNNAIVEMTHGNYKQLSLEFILGYALSPLMFGIGVCWQDMTLMGQLLGEKLIASEFVGYISLAGFKDAGMFVEAKSIFMATYMLCGFANFASIGIQIGGIGGLAPSKRELLSQYGIRAVVAGSLASLMSATIVGMIMG